MKMGIKKFHLPSPPLFRLDAEKENMMRILKTAGDLPSDRESVFISM